MRGWQEGQDLEGMRYKKEELLEILRKNREGHQIIFEEAVAGYAKRREQQLEEQLADIRSRKVHEKYEYLPLPVNQTQDYDRVIKMIELQQDSFLDLSEQEIAWYVLDQWHWRDAFITSNAFYSAGARSLQT